MRVRAARRMRVRVREPIEPDGHQQRVAVQLAVLLELPRGHAGEGELEVRALWDEQRRGAVVLLLEAPLAADDLEAVGQAVGALAQVDGDARRAEATPSARRGFAWPGGGGESAAHLSLVLTVTRVGHRATDGHSLLDEAAAGRLVVRVACGVPEEAAEAAEAPTARLLERHFRLSRVVKGVFLDTIIP